MGRDPLQDTLHFFERAASAAASELNELVRRITGVDAELTTKRLQLGQARLLLGACRDLETRCGEVEAAAASVGSMLQSAFDNAGAQPAAARRVAVNRAHIERARAAAQAIVNRLEGEIFDIERSRADLDRRCGEASARRSRALADARSTRTRIAKRS